MKLEFCIRSRRLFGAAILVCCLTVGRTASADRAVYATGWNQYGQLGNGLNINRSTPDQVLGLGGQGFLTDVIAVSAGGNHSLALKSDGTVWAWGEGDHGRLGNGSTVDHLAPVQVLGPDGVGVLTDVVAISTTLNHNLALKSDGTVWAWGLGNWGILGNGSTSSQYTPVQVVGVEGAGVLEGVVAVSAGHDHSLALKSDGTVWAWGTGSRLGNGISSASATPVQVLGLGGQGFLSGVVKISAGGTHSLAMQSDGTLWAWGVGGYGQLGNGEYSSTSTPVLVLEAGGQDNITNVVDVSAGYKHSLAVKSDGTVWAWGDNRYFGMLGNGSADPQSTPVQVVGVDGAGVLTGVVAVSAGGYHSLAVKADGTVWAWGRGFEGQLGSGSLSNQTTPVQVLGVDGVGFLTGIVQVSAGTFDTLFCYSNSLPTANAGPDQTVTASHGGDPTTDTGAFTLDGTASSDLDGDTLTYEWKYGGSVVGTTVTLALTRTSGTHTFTLRVTDIYGEYSEDDVIVTVNAAPNTSPVANAGTDQTVLSNEGVILRLDGSASSDPDSDALTYVWSESGADIAYGSNPYAYFEPGIHIVTLTVTDTYGASDESAAVITVSEANRTPVSEAGPDQTVTASHGGNPATDTGAFTLDGSGSSDPDGDTLTYEWTEGRDVIGTAGTLSVRPRRSS